MSGRFYPGVSSQIAAFVGLCALLCAACVPAGFRMGDELPGGFDEQGYRIDDELRGLAAADFGGKGGRELLVMTPERVLLLTRGGARVVAVAQSGEQVSLEAIDPDRDGRSDFAVVGIGETGASTQIWSLGGGGGFWRAGPYPSRLYFWPRVGLVGLGASMGIGPKARRPLLLHTFDPGKAGGPVKPGAPVLELHPSMIEGEPLPYGDPARGVAMVDRSGVLERVRGREVVWSAPTELNLGISSLLIERAAPGMLAGLDVETFRVRPPPSWFDLDGDLVPEMILCVNSGKEIPILSNLRRLQGSALVVLRTMDDGSLELFARQNGQVGTACAGTAVLTDDWGPLLLMAVRDRGRGNFRKAASRVLAYRIEGDRIVEAEPEALRNALAP